MKITTFVSPYGADPREKQIPGKTRDRSLPCRTWFQTSFSSLSLSRSRPFSAPRLPGSFSVPSADDSAGPCSVSSAAADGTFPSPQITRSRYRSIPLELNYSCKSRFPHPNSRALLMHFRFPSTLGRLEIVCPPSVCCSFSGLWVLLGSYPLNNGIISSFRDETATMGGLEETQEKQRSWRELAGLGTVMLGFIRFPPGQWCWGLALDPGKRTVLLVGKYVEFL